MRTRTRAARHRTQVLLELAVRAAERQPAPHVVPVEPSRADIGLRTAAMEEHLPQLEEQRRSR